MGSDRPLAPFSLVLDRRSGAIRPCNNHIVRRLSDMAARYADAATVQEMLEWGDPVLYEAHRYNVPEDQGQILVVTTRIYPRVIGDEYVMTKGHFHARRDTAEVYLGLHGCGHHLLQTAEGDFQSMAFGQGDIAYIPAFWAHRMVNSGDQDLIFCGVYPAHAGHDYRPIEQQGFRFLLVDRHGVPSFVGNPRHRVA